MKKIVWITLLFALAVVGLYYANTYTSAMVENPVSLSVSNPDGLIALIPHKNAEIMQGENKDVKALTLTNNMGVYISYEIKLEQLPEGISLQKKIEGTLAPGKTDKIAIELRAEDNCTIGEFPLEITLSADFNGGRAEIKTTFPLTVIEAPQENEGEDEKEGKGDDDENKNEDDAVTKEGDSEGQNSTPAVPGEGPQAGAEEGQTDDQDGTGNDTPPDIEVNGTVKPGEGLTDDQEEP